MGDTITCTECGDEVESMAELEESHRHEVPEFDEDEDGGFHLYGNRDLFLCKNCKNPLGIRRD
jgi:hypothetical protein